MTLAVAPFSGAHYHRNAKRCRDNEQPCAICGRPLGHRSKTMAFETTEGMGAWKVEGDGEQSGGWFEIGLDCYRRYRAAR